MHAKYFSLRKERILPETCLFSVFNVLSTNSLKCMEYKIGGILKTYILSFMRFLRTKSAKTHPKPFLWKNRITLPKVCIFSVFEIVSYKNTKMHAKYPSMGKETILQETSHVSKTNK